MIRKLLIVFASGLVLSVALLSAAWVVGGDELSKAGSWRHGDWEDWAADDEFFDESEKRKLAGFTGVVASGGLHVEITAGAPFDVEVTGPRPELIMTKLSGTNLVIRPRHSMFDWGGFPNHLVRVSVPELEKISSSAASRVMASGVDAPKLSISASSGSRLRVEGACGDLDADASSGANLTAEGLSCQKGRAEASSGGKLRVAVSEQLDVDASSGGEVSVTGNPRMGRISLSSGGELHRQDAERTKHIDESEQLSID